MLEDKLVNREFKKLFVFTLIKEQQGQIRSAGLQFHQPKGLFVRMYIQYVPVNTKKAQATLDQVYFIFIFWSFCIIFHVI